MSDVTRLLLAAAHLYNNEIFDILEPRRLSRFKAPAPELQLDRRRLYSECRAGRDRENIRRIALLIWILFVTWKMAFDWLPFLTALVVGTAVIELLAHVARKVYVRRRFLPPCTDDEPTEWGPADDNVIVFDGYSPFVGSGCQVADWSSVVDLTRPQDSTGDSLRSLSVPDLYAEVSAAIEALPTPDLELADRVLVSGDSVRRDDRFLNGPLGRPKTRLKSRHVRRLMTANEPRVRFYRVARISAWGGHLVLSMFFRFEKRGDCLFVDVNFFLLPALREKYLQIDSMTRRFQHSELTKGFLLRLLTAPVVWLDLARWVAKGADGIYDRSNKETRVADDPLYSYGWSDSIRERCSRGDFHRFFHAKDCGMYMQLLQQCIVTALIESLRERGISTEALAKTENTMINHGIVIHGGAIRAGNLAVGKKASIFRDAFKAVGTASATQRRNSKYFG